MTASMTTAINFLKSLLLIGAYLALMSLVTWNFPALATATHSLLERAGSLSALEVAGVKISFNTASVAAQLDFDSVSMADKENTVAHLKSLEPDQFERLMHVGELKNLCDYGKPTVEMRRMIALDYQLSDKGLADITDAPELFQQIEEGLAADEKNGQSAPLGHPRSCYNLALTKDGANVKTALVRLVSVAFTQHVAMK